MKPSFSIHKSKEQAKSKIYKNIINCPNGTVPILRNAKQYVAKSQYFAKKHFNPFTVESHGTHFAGVRLHHGPYYGILSWISVHDLNISGDQAPYAHIYVGRRFNNKDNVIQVGWMVNPSIFGDGQTWSYGFWKGANGESCYNTVCPGFIQVSKTNPLSEPIRQAPAEERNIALTIQKVKKSKNWWVLDVNYKKPDILLGYWPGELFDLIDNGVDIMGVGGAVESSPSGRSPPMGNGHLPTQDDMESARVYTILYLDQPTAKTMKIVDKSYKLEKLLDSEKCYGLNRGKKMLFTFGGPGGNSCGI
ncbi:uncharacterized protein LOC18018077 [Eutrema salsugineum]|uniref:uncharacterized protein LOC18018077 n=1 Tax=Eutrema salsugineum TaxID=72664 RepID=UPI000CED75C9|nr:uncharacterized protein LOC18018077 [Eutrema salsugineum]